MSRKCSRCHKRQPVDGRVQCRKCLDYGLRYQRKRRGVPLDAPVRPRNSTGGACDGPPLKGRAPSLSMSARVTELEAKVAKLEALVAKLTEGGA